jgi:ribose transport system substrate-binding protein
MRKVSVVVTVVTILAMLSANAWAAGEQESESAGEKPVVGLVMKSLGAEFFKNMEEGAIEHAEERGDLELLALGTQSQTEIDQQIQIVENLVSRNVDGIVIAPMDGTALVPPVAKAVEEGIEVVNIDVMFDDATMDEYGIEVPFVGPDNVAAAKMVGDRLAEELGEGAKVIIIEGLPAAVNAQQRKEGFMQSVEEYNLQLLASRTANWEIEEAFSVFSNLLTRYSDVEGVMCANDAMALGVVQAIDAAGKTGEIEVVGFDNDESIRPLIREGKVLATVDQFARDMAAIGIDFAMEMIQEGKDYTGWQKTPVELVTAEDLE